MASICSCGTYTTASLPPEIRESPCSLPIQNIASGCCRRTGPIESFMGIGKGTIAPAFSPAGDGRTALKSLVSPCPLHSQDQDIRGLPDRLSFDRPITSCFQESIEHRLSGEQAGLPDTNGLPAMNAFNASLMESPHQVAPPAAPVHPPPVHNGLR